MDVPVVRIPDLRFDARYETREACVGLEELFYLPAAVGLPAELQDRLRELCPGHNRENRQGQITWRHFGDCWRAWKRPLEHQRLRMSEELWAHIDAFAHRLGLQ